MRNRETFPASDLVKVDATRVVVLNSGSPLMTIEAVEGEQAVCSWADDGGTVRRAMFKCVCLSRLVPLTPEECQSLLTPEAQP